MGAASLIERWSQPAWWAAIATFAAFTPALVADPASAEFQAALYGGFSESFDSDITLNQPNGTNVTLNSVPWDGASFEAPPYWGARGIYWLDNHPNWGLMVDYNHAKVIAEQGASVGVSGTRDGIAIGPRDRVGNTFDVMEFTDGLNQIFAGVMYRWQHDRWTPHVGFGVGASVPHVEVRRAGSEVRTFDYQLTGLAVEGLVGLEYRLGPRLSAFGDYKLSICSNDADLNGGGTLETDIWTNHFVLGLSYSFGDGDTASLKCAYPSIARPPQLPQNLRKERG